MTNIILIITATLTALIAGLFYAYSCSVNLGLGRLTDKEYLTAMQSINRAILNPLFFSSFIGTLIMLPLCTYLHYQQINGTRFILLFAATLVYATGTFGITILGNVPLNNMLDKFNIKTASIEEISVQRERFEKSWLWLHNIRTVAAVISLILVITSCCCNRE
ncbi:MAG: DUF1772 domain-containing protein [Mucilaginibacter sp.]|uniref:anthrone oxygenase family protein n=1 Tax=Mucilaginibacter sp. TaxID=1882438 RepID=UPI00319EC291